jgi:hypothetical protein
MSQTPPNHHTPATLPLSADKTYRLIDTDGDEYNTDNPWRCISPGAKPGGADTISIPQEVALTVGADKKMTLSWSMPNDEVPFVFGYKVTLTWEDVENDDWQMNKWNGKLYRTYTDNVFTSIPANWGLAVTPGPQKTTYTLATGVTVTGTGAQKAELVTFNLDAEDSAPASVVIPGAGSQQRFDAPKYKGYRVDRCYRVGAECDKPAADAFCKTQGYKSSSDFKLTSGGTPPTIVLFSEWVCNEPVCSSFEYVVCQN